MAFDILLFISDIWIGSWQSNCDYPCAGSQGHLLMSHYSKEKIKREPNSLNYCRRGVVQ